MDPLGHSNIINYLKSGKIPEDVTTKVAKQCFKRRTSSYQLGKENKLLKVNQINYLIPTKHASKSHGFRKNSG